MINCVIFSKDRAMQLTAMLESLTRHCIDYESMQIVVLFACSSAQHSKQYQILSKDWEHIPQIKFYQEKSFRNDLLTILNPFRKSTIRGLFYINICHISPRIIRYLPFGWLKLGSDSKVLFLVDDSIFTHDFSIVEASSCLLKEEKAIGFSLRLGKNTTDCYMTRKTQDIPIFTKLTDDILMFNWTIADADFGYPLEVSSSIYRLSEMLPLLFRINFNNPNSFEVGLFENNVIFRKSHPQLLCFRQSVAFCNPINMVQNNIIENRAGESKKYSSTELSDLFLKGYRINVIKLSGLITNSCHQEVDLEFIKH